MVRSAGMFQGDVWMHKECLTAAPPVRKAPELLVSLAPWHNHGHVYRQQISWHCERLAFHDLHWWLVSRGFPSKERFRRSISFRISESKGSRKPHCNGFAEVLPEDSLPQLAWKNDVRCAFHTTVIVDLVKNSSEVGFSPASWIDVKP